MSSLATNSRNPIIAILIVLLLVIPTAVAEDASFNSTRKTSKDIAVNYELDSGIEWDASINQMEDGFKTNLDTWGPFIDGHDGKWVGGMSPEQLLAVNATGVLNNVTVGGLHSFTPHDVMGAGMSEGWVRSPIQQVENSEVGMDVYHVQNPQFAELVPGLGVPSVTSTAANWTSDYNATAMSHWEAGMGEYNEWCNYNVVDGLLGSWCADEGVGSVVADNSGNGNDATHNLADWGIGRYGGNNKAVTLDHTYSEVTAGDILPEDSEGNRTGFTVGGWFRSDNIVDQMGTFDLSDSSSRGMLYTQSSGKLLFYAGSSNYVYWPEGTTSLFIDGTYHHLMLSVAGEEQADIADVKFYIDGVEHPKWFHSSGGPILSPYNLLQYGGAYGPNGWDGEIDAMVLYDHQLTADEALAVYNVGKPNPDGTFVLAPATDQAGSADWNTHDPNMMGWDDEASTGGGALGLAPKVWGNKETSDQCPAGSFHGVSGNLEGLWCFEEGGGTTSVDSSGNGHDLSLFTGDATWVTGGSSRFGMQFDGVNDEMAASGSAGVLSGSTDFTVSFWYEGEDLDVIMNNADAGCGSGYDGWQVQSGGSDARWKIYDDGASNANDALYKLANVWEDHWGDGSGWHHLVWSQEYMGQGNWYIDGVLQESSTQFDVLDYNFCQTTGIRFGSNGGDYATGSLDNVAIYSESLDQTQVTALYNINTISDITYADNLVGQWLMGEGSGSVVYDTSGNENHGATTGAGVSSQGGYIGAARSFDSTAWVELQGFTMDEMIPDAATISMWVKPNAAAWDAEQRLISGYAAGTPRWHYYLCDPSDSWPCTGGNYHVELYEHGTNKGVGQNRGQDYELDTWFNVVVAFDGIETLDLYYNGVWLDATTGFPGFGTAGMDMIIGDANFEGAIDELNIWDRALSSYEIYNLYTSSYDLHENEYYQSSYGSFAGIEDAYVNPTTVIALEAVYSDSISETYPGRAYMPDDTDVSEYYDVGELEHLYLFDEGQGVLVGDSGPNPIGGRILDSDYCAGQYSQPPSTTNYLQGAWCFNEGTGTTAYESHDEVNHGILVNGPTWVDGHIETGLDFDDTNDYVKLNTPITYASDITVSAWARCDKIPKCTNYDTIVGSNAFWDGFLLTYDGSGHVLFYLGEGDPATVSSAYGTTVVDNEWHHIVGTFDGTTINVYLDGVLEGSTVASFGSITYSGDTFIGADETNPPGLAPHNVFDGRIDEVVIYDAALTAADILELYHVTDPGGVWTTGAIGTGVSFDDDKVVLAANIGEGPGAGEPWSMSFWMQIHEQADGNPVNRQTLLTGTGFTIYFWNSNYFRVTDGADHYSDGTMMSDWEWHHIVFTCDPGNQPITYVDGVLEGVVSGGNCDGDLDISTFGYQCCTSGYWADFALDDLAIYSEILSAADALALYSMSQSRFQSGQMAYWPLDFNGAAGNTYDWISEQSYDCAGAGPDDCIFDHSNNDNTGRLGGGFDSNEPVWTPDCRFSNNYCLDFDGANDYVDLNYGNGVDAQAGFTVSGWIKVDSLGGNSMWLGSDTGTNQRFYIGLRNDYFSFGYANTGWSTGGQLITAGDWYHVAVTTTRGEQKLYVNGVENVAQAKAVSSSFTLASDFWIGAIYGNSYNWDGAIDEVMVWSRALDADEILELFDTTKADCVTYPLTCNPKPQSGHLTRFQVWGSDTNDFTTATLEAEWTEGTDYFMSSEGGRNILSLAAEVPYLRFWWWTVNMTNEYQSTPILHSVMLEMELFTQPYTLVPSPLSDPDLCWSNNYDTPDNDDLHEFYLDPNSATYGRHYLNFKCPIYAGRDVNGDSLSDDGYVFIFSAGSGKVNATWEVWLSQSMRGMDFMKSWVNVYDIDKGWMNDTLPLSMGSDLFFTRGMNHGITGWELLDEDNKYDRMVGIEFYTELPVAFSAAEDDELTFHIPFETPNGRICCFAGSPFQGLRYEAEVAGYTSDMLQTGVTTSIGSNYLVDDTLLISGTDGVGHDGLWLDTSVLDGATILRFRLAFEWFDEGLSTLALDEVTFYSHDANSDFDMGESANFFNKHTQLGCDIILNGNWVGCETLQHIGFTPVHHVSVGPDFWVELNTGIPNQAPVTGPKYLYDAYQWVQPTIVCTVITGCIASTQLTEYELEFADNMAKYEAAAVECGKDAGYGEEEYLSSAAIYSCTKFAVWDSADFAYEAVKFYGYQNDWQTTAYQSQLDGGGDILGMVSFKELYALLNFQDGSMWEAAWVVGAFAEGVITVVVTVLQDNIGLISDFLVTMTRFMTFLFIMGSIIGSTRVINNSLHGRWELVNYNCATGLTQAAGFMSVIPFIGSGMANVTRSAVGNLNKYRPPLKSQKRSNRKK